MHQRLYSQKTPHISPSRASYGVSFARILMKIDCVIITLYNLVEMYIESCPM